MYHRTAEPLPESLRGLPDPMTTFRSRAAQCLIATNYVNPASYIIEAMLHYSISEYLTHPDAQSWGSILLGIIIKLAMRMGYHRDPKHYPNISPFEGEMRRRTWAVIYQLEHLVSFQVGLPRAVRDWECDTKPPHNLFDEDFDKSSASLPPSRPQTDRTPASYTIAKAKINSVFGKIIDMLFSRRQTPYDEVMKLDKSLQDARAAIPPFLQIRSRELLITDPPDLVMQRYTLELLYQKTRCILHRKYLTKTRADLRYTYSRWACVNAATEILRHQADINRETREGGQLHRDRWFITSLQHHDFLLAAMIICLELSQTPERAAQAQSRQLNDKFKVTFEGRDELMKALETSYEIWASFRHRSTDAYKAYEVLGVILHKVKITHPDIYGGAARLGNAPEDTIVVRTAAGKLCYPITFY